MKIGNERGEVGAMGLIAALAAVAVAFAIANRQPDNARTSSFALAGGFTLITLIGAFIRGPSIGLWALGALAIAVVVGVLAPTLGIGIDSKPTVEFGTLVGVMAFFLLLALRPS